jgi:PAS domain S-box-containing protein
VIHPLALAAAFAALYATAALLSQALASGLGVTATFWIPSGLYFAALARSRRASWAPLIAGAVVAHVAVSVLGAGRALVPAVGFALAHTLEAVVGVLALQVVGGLPHVGRIRYTLRLVAVAAIVSAVPGALVGAAVAIAQYEASSFLAAWRSWWGSDLLAILLVGAPLLTPGSDWRALWQSLRGRRGVEGAAAVTLVVLAAWAVYWHPPNPLRAAFFLMPGLLWVTFRFGATGLMVTLIPTAAIAIRGTLTGHGPLASLAGSPDAAFVVQLFMSVGGTCFLVLAAALQEREDSVQELRQRDQDARVRHFADSAPAILWASDVGGRRTFVSRGWYELTGLPDGAGLGHGWAESVHPDDRDATFGTITSAMMRRAAYQQRYRIRCADGAYRWVMSAGQPQRDERGEVVGYVGSLIDVNDYTAATVALAQADALLDAVFQGAPVGLAFLDRHLRFQRINERLASINGLPIEAHIGHTPPELLPGIENMPRIMADFRRILATGQPLLGVEVTGETPATPGDRHEWRENFFPVSVAGEVVGIGVVAEDVTEQKRTEQALRVSEARFRKLAEAGPVIVWVTGPDGVQYLSPRWSEFTGRPTPRDHDIEAALEPVHPDDRASARHEWFGSEAVTAFETEFRLRRHDGEYRWFLSRGLAITADDGRIVQRVGAYVDIHARKVAERELLDAGRRKDEFLAMLAHELRNPLAPIQNAVHILQLADPGSAAHASARDIIARQLTHIVRLVDDLLDVSRLSRGKLSIQREPTDLAAVVRDTATDFKQSFEERGVPFDVQVPSCSVWVDGDRTRLAQVVGNLLHNAQKFTPSGGSVRLRLECDFERELARIYVEDTGVGMSGELLERVFDEFSQGTQTLDRGAGGLGLGLALVKRFVELHGGRADATSEGPGRGSQFIVHLPARATERSADRTTDRTTAVDAARM